ncbi:hypothetical protein A5823_001385 [Enterococcus faecalis]|nr:hypothetical protein A5823_001385 [Enterococcus faecalis]
MNTSDKLELAAFFATFLVIPLILTFTLKEPVIIAIVSAIVTFFCFID